MNTIQLIVVGKVKEKWISLGIDEFLKRLSAFAKVEIIELKDEGVEKESSKIMKYVDENCYVLDETGDSMDSVGFAKLIKDKNLTLVIGGADGTSSLVKEKSKLISFSKMTFTHEMCRLFLIKQIYRGFMINRNRKYHR